MPSRTTKAHRPDATDRYFELVRAFPLRPVRDDAELRRAVEIIDSLTDREKLAPDEDDYLQVLAGLVESYEDEHHPMPPASDADMLRHLIESRGVTQAEVSARTDIAESTLSSILAGRRGISKNHIAALAKYFKVKPSVFISA
jgi:HTH-type transcriptional regulator / antitoxin HigA